MANYPGLPPEKLTLRKMVKVTIEVDDPPDKTKTETFNTDKYVYCGGTRNVKRKVVRIKVS